jgi:hypothetical protein
MAVSLRGESKLTVKTMGVSISLVGGVILARTNMEQFHCFGLKWVPHIHDEGSYQSTPTYCGQNGHALVISVDLEARIYSTALKDEFSIRSIKVI